MKVATVPNLICLLRMALTVPIVMLLAEGRYAQTLVLFAIAAVSDMLDGFLAKTFGWTSELGKMPRPARRQAPARQRLHHARGASASCRSGSRRSRSRATSSSVSARSSTEVALRPGRGPADRRLEAQHAACSSLTSSRWSGMRLSPDLPDWLVPGLGALVLVTTVVSGVDYVADLHPQGDRRQPRPPRHRLIPCASCRSGVQLGVSLRFETFARRRQCRGGRGAARTRRRQLDARRSGSTVRPGSGKSHLLQAACARGERRAGHAAA